MMSISTNVNLSPNALQASRNNNLQPDYAAGQETVTNIQQTDKKQEILDKEDVTKMTSEMSKFMQLINSDIQFQLHEETKQLIVQVVDTRDGTVLKEFPPHELLDTMAKIREYVGILLDKKA